jgi:hypothetical protein
MQELASVLGYGLTGDARPDVHRLESELEAYVDFDIYDAPMESDDEYEDDELDSDEDEDGINTDNDSQA